MSANPLSNNRLLVLRCICDHPGTTIVTLGRYMPPEMPLGTALRQLGPLCAAALIHVPRQDERRYYITTAGHAALRAHPPPGPFSATPFRVPCGGCTQIAKREGYIDDWVYHYPPVHMPVT
jgi:hypothetical protein